MSINALGVVTTDFTKQVSAEANGKAIKPSGHTAAPKVTTEDTTSFTSAKPAVKTLTQTALQTTPSREAKVEALKLQVNSAQYQLDSAKIAESLINAAI